jgi:hypothetical protein
VSLAQNTEFDREGECRFLALSCKSQTLCAADQSLVFQNIW